MHSSCIVRNLAQAAPRTGFIVSPCLRSLRQLPLPHPRLVSVAQPRQGYSTLHQSSRTHSGTRRWGPVTIGLALCPIITFGLGTWQVQRLRWKVDLIENLEDRMSLDAIPLPRKV
ncbi:surf-like protein, partial [Podila epicladia]